MNKPFILATKKQKIEFVNFTLNQIKIALEQSGRKMAVSTQLNFKFKMLKKLGVVEKEINF